MQNSLRYLGLCLGATLGLAAMAQTYQVTISGQVTPCSPAVADGTVHVRTASNTVPYYDMDVDLDADCAYSITLDVTDATGTFELGTICMNGMIAMATVDYTIDLLTGTASVTADLNCDGPPAPCNACMTLTAGIDPFLNTPIPFTVQGTNCSSGGVAPYTYSWDWGDGMMDTQMNSTHVYANPGIYTVCLTVADASGCVDVTCDEVVIADDGTVNPNSNVPCQAGFWVMQAYTGDPNNGIHGDPIPNELWIWNLSQGGTGLFQFLWSFGDGTSSTEAFPSHTYPDGGPYVLCLTITDDAGCTSTYCDSLSVDEDGMLRDADTEGFTINVMQPLTTGIPQLPVTQLSSWPNPVTDQLNIALGSNTAGNVQLQVVDPSGRVVVDTQHALVNGANRLTVPTDDLTPGVYILRIGQGNEAAVLRFVKTR